MGEVYRAYNEPLDRWVAVKQLLPEAEDNPDSRQRLLREARAAAQLCHPNIARVFDPIEAEGSDWVAMELVDGQPLNALLRAGPLSPNRALILALELSEGLTAAHAQGIVHHDLKASNVIITAQDHAKILDFGLARPFERREYKTALSMDGEVLGTPRSMSPEQAQGGDVDHRSDLFSFGILLYEMVTGVSPFLGSTLIGTLKRVCVHQQAPAHELVPTVPREFSDLIDLLLEKDPGQRPQGAAEVTIALLRVPN